MIYYPKLPPQIGEIEGIDFEPLIDLLNTILAQHLCPKEKQSPNDLAWKKLHDYKSGKDKRILLFKNIYAKMDVYRGEIILPVGIVDNDGIPLGSIIYIPNEDRFVINWVDNGDVCSVHIAITTQTVRLIILFMTDEESRRNMEISRSRLPYPRPADASVQELGSLKKDVIDYILQHKSSFCDPIHVNFGEVLNRVAFSHAGVTYHAVMRRAGENNSQFIRTSISDGRGVCGSFWFTPANELVIQTPFYSGKLAVNEDELERYIEHFIFWKSRDENNQSF